MPLFTFLIGVLLTSIIAIWCSFRVCKRYIDQIRYLTFVNDLMKDDMDSVLLRLSADFWFRPFIARGDTRTINLILRKLKTKLFDISCSPFVIGQALGKLSRYNKKCQIRAVEYCSTLTSKRNDCTYLISLMIENPKISKRQFINLARELHGDSQRQLVNYLSTDDQCRKLLNLL